MKPVTKKIALAYLRSNNGNEGSLATQREAIADFARRKGYVIAGEREETHLSGVSKDFSWTDEYFKDPSHGQVKFLLVYSDDRVSRDYSTFLEVEEHLKEVYGVFIAAVTGNKTLRISAVLKRLKPESGDVQVSGRTNMPARKGKK